MPEIELSAAMPGAVDAGLRDHLIKGDGEEDLNFALWTPSRGASRLTALVHTPLLPLEGDRQRHGNASFNQQYLERACAEAIRSGYGVAFMHGHLGPGWQEMSEDDVNAERRMAGAVESLTGLPLFGLTVGTDGAWSARAWEHAGGRLYERRWCRSTRVVGESLRAYFADLIAPKPKFRELFRRTVTVWGEESHADLARLRVGIVGLGSVGSMVAEDLARMGLRLFTLIDFDEVQPHNLDRLLGATEDDIGEFKVEVARRQILKSATAAGAEVRAVPYSVVEEEGYKATLDCDVVFSCVDRPRARSILNHMAYAHLIPVVDGGIEVRFRRGLFSGVDWQLQTVAPDRPCLQCLGAFDPGDVSTEIEGKLDDPSYLKGLPPDHRFKRNENVFPFSANLASLEVMQFIALATGAAGITDFGVQRFRYVPGILESDVEQRCREGCDNIALTAKGDSVFHLYGRDLAAEEARRRRDARLRQ